jgi:protein RecA
MAPKNDRDQAIDAAIASIERSFGKGAIMRYGTSETPQVEVISTGSISLDLCLGVGGVPLGRVVEIFGSESSGKTTLALHIIAEAQKRGGVAAFIDAEHALDVNYARKLGVNVEELLISPARPRRAGARDRRVAGALQRRRGHRHRLRRRPRPQGRAGGQHGRPDPMAPRPG